MVDRRKFLKLGVAAASAPLLSIPLAKADEPVALKQGGEDYSHFSGVKHKSIPSVCGQCPSHCAIIGYIDQGRLVKIEGNPDSIRNEGRCCAKGQAGAQKAYDPDRILKPLRRVGKRGEGKWKQVSWDEALTELTGHLQKLRDDGTPEKFVFQHGWIPLSSEKLIDDIFLPAYGTASIIKQTCQSQSARWTAHELTWGGSVDNWDLEHTKYVLNFGSNLLEAHTNYVSLAKRLAKAFVDRRLNLRMVTFDVRLSNTAANSDLWLPIKPGTDLAVVLAMCNIIMSEDLYVGEGEQFLDFCRVSDDVNLSRAQKIAILKEHLAQYTAEWAESISGVPASQIYEIAREFATIKQACVISSRGSNAHYNGVETERAIQMLCAITGNVGTKGGRCRAVFPHWEFPSGPKDLPKAKMASFIEDSKTTVTIPVFGASHSVFKRIRESKETAGVYMWYHHNPAYANQDTLDTVTVLKDESLIPFTVAVTPFYDETAALADLILPDATYLERYDIEETESANQIAEYSLRQPLIEVQGEARDFKDVVLELADRMGFPLGFKSSTEFIEQACKLTPVVSNNAKGFKGLKKTGVWHDEQAVTAYQAYQDPVPGKALNADGVILDEATGVYWNWKEAGVSSESKAKQDGYSATANASNGYVGQKVGDRVFAAFAPGKLNKSGLFELYSPILKAGGVEPLPSYVSIPGHVNLGQDELVLTTFKLVVQVMSNTGNSGWLSEIQNDNPAWINSKTAEERGISDGDKIVIESKIGKVNATARVTQAVVPGVLAIATHFGRSEGGRYASGKVAPFGAEDRHHDKYKWWPSAGTNVNPIIPDSPEPISGQQCWMDTVVKVTVVNETKV